MSLCTSQLHILKWGQSSQNMLWPNWLLPFTTFLIINMGHVYDGNRINSKIGIQKIAMFCSILIWFSTQSFSFFFFIIKRSINTFFYNLFYLAIYVYWGWGEGWGRGVEHTGSIYWLWRRQPVLKSWPDTTCLRQWFLKLSGKSESPRKLKLHITEPYLQKF